jgi:hypothetical protein
LSTITSEVKPKALVPVFAMIPDDLTVLHQWVNWRYEGRPVAHGIEWTKPPYIAGTTSKASSTNPDTWRPFEDVVAAYEHRDCDGVGFALTPPFVGVDLDDVVDPATGAIHPEATRIIGELNSYTERSPSGRGLRIVTRGSLPSGWRNIRTWAVPIEMYDGGRYLTVTGAHLDGTPTTVEERTAQLAGLHARVANSTVKGTATTKGSGHVVAVQNTPTDEVVLTRMFAASNGARIRALWAGDRRAHGDDHSVADLALCSHLAYWTGNDRGAVDRLFRQSGLMRKKWDERHFGDGRTYGEETLNKALRGLAVTPAETPNMLPEPPPLAVPEMSLVGVARDFALLHAEYLESPAAFFYFDFLTYFGNLIADKVTLDSELRPEPRLYTVKLGPSADARKSTSQWKVDQFFSNLEPPFQPRVLKVSAAPRAWPPSLRRAGGSSCSSTS